MNAQTNTIHARFKAAAFAAVCTIALTGCSGLSQLPFTMPDLSGVPNPFAVFDNTPSVEEARKEALTTESTMLQPGDLVADGILTVGLKNKEVSAPFIITAKDKSMYGMDIAVASAMADYLGLHIRFVSVTDVDTALANGVCDIVMDASPNHVNSSTIVGSYYESAVAFFTKGERRVVTVDELDGKKVGLQDGSVSQGVLERTGINMTQTTYGDLNKAFEALESGAVDYVLCDAYSGAYLASLYDDVDFAGALSMPSPQGVAVSSDKTNLQVAAEMALGTVVNGGVLDIIRATYIGGMPAISTEDVIANIPDVETVDTNNGEQVQDGSTAGANAVVL